VPFYQNTPTLIIKYGELSSVTFRQKY